jgi:hypothetical protein
MWRQPPSAVRPRQRPSLLLAPEIQSSDNGHSRIGEGTAFHGSRAGKSNRPLGDGRPKAAVPTQASDHIQGRAKPFPAVCPSSSPVRSPAFR